MEECMNDNNVCARLRLMSMCVFPKVVSDNVRVLKSVVQDARLDKQQHRGNRCQHNRKDKPTRRLRRKSQCVEQIPARCAENARAMVPEEETRRQSEPESEPEPKSVNTEGSKKTEMEMQTQTRHQPTAPERYGRMH